MTYYGVAFRVPTIDTGTSPKQERHTTRLTPQKQEKDNMKKTLSTHEAADLLKQDDNASWSRAGALALVEYLEQLEDDTGEPIEFDAVAIRCDYTEHADLQDWAGGYWGTVAGEDQAAEGVGYDPEDDDETKDAAIREYIEDNGQLIEFDGGIIVSSF